MEKAFLHLSDSMVAWPRTQHMGLCFSTVTYSFSCQEI